MTDVLHVEGLSVEYAGRAGGRRRHPATKAVEAVNLSIAAASTVALVGESGSGKTSVARAILGLAPKVSGTVELSGELVASVLRRRTLQQRARVQMVFQQPSGSLDPRLPVGTSIGEPLRHLDRVRGPVLTRRVVELLSMVGLDESFASRLPRQLSGGQRQRAAVARAISTSPALVIADEPTSSLDVSVQAQIVNLFVRLQETLGIAYLFISHDLGVVRQIADEITVLSAGRVVESGPVDRVLDHPVEPYTRALISAVPSLAEAGSGGWSATPHTHRWADDPAPAGDSRAVDI